MVYFEQCKRFRTGKIVAHDFYQICTEWWLCGSPTYLFSVPFDDCKFILSCFLRAFLSFVMVFMETNAYRCELDT